MLIARSLALLIVAAAAGACRPDASDENIVIDNNVAANADIDVLPPDESSVANVEKLFETNKLPIIAFQVANCSPAIRTLQSNLPAGADGYT